MINAREDYGKTNFGGSEVNGATLFGVCNSLETSHFTNFLNSIKLRMSFTRNMSIVQAIKQVIPLQFFIYPLLAIPIALHIYSSYKEQKRKADRVPPYRKDRFDAYMYLWARGFSCKPAIRILAATSRYHFSIIYYSLFLDGLIGFLPLHLPSRCAMRININTNDSMKWSTIC
jgi:hypothetical protein